MTRRDPAAFAEFVAARSTALHRTAYLLVGERHLAQDLLQEALTTTAITWYRRKSWQGERPSDDLPERAHGGHVDRPAPP